MIRNVQEPACAEGKLPHTGVFSLKTRYSSSELLGELPDTLQLFVCLFLFCFVFTEVPVESIRSQKEIK